jgi:murein DD-endopeptidase MepM/ murein hydrolase activator NlpD
MAVGSDRIRYTSANKLRFLVGGIAADRFYAWGQPVHAPFSGEVVRASDGWPDHPKVSMISTVRIWVLATFLFRPKQTAGGIDIRPNVGNHVMLRHSSGVVAFFAHLQSGSVRVEPGQQLGEGELLGAVGNSGNSTAPHLHLNLFDQVDDLMHAIVVPFFFRQYMRWDGVQWTVIRNHLPRKGEVLSPCAERSTQ